MNERISGAFGVAVGVACVVAATWLDSSLTIVRHLTDGRGMHDAYVGVAVVGLLSLGLFWFVGRIVRRAGVVKGLFMRLFGASVLMLAGVALVVGVIIDGLSIAWFIGVALTSVTTLAGFASTRSA